ncbi:MAG: OmpA family protein [Flavobacteriaceae bacterium]|nr:OmpA family protein [Flavobacteriaceae bacterium]
MKQLLLFSIFVFIGSLMAQSNKTYKIKNIDVNTKYSDFGASFYGDYKLIYTSAKRGLGNNAAIWNENKQPFLDLYLADVNPNGEISDSKRLSEIINSKFHEGTVAVSSDLRTIYFTRDNYFKNKKLKDQKNYVNLGIYVSHLDNKGDWSSIESLPFNNKDYSCGHPSLSSDGKRLYFSSDMPGGYGKTDLYYVEIKSDGNYGLPVNLGKIINSAGHDKFPFIGDDNTLYFSSDGRKGLGKLDVYAISLNNGNKLEPYHIEAPINSSADDFAFVIDFTNNKGYFSSNREGGKGDDDIYFFEANQILADCNQKVHGKVFEYNKKTNLAGTEIVLYDENGDKLKSVTVNQDAGFSFELECRKNYQLVANKKGYTETIKKITTTDENLKTYDLTIELPKEEFVSVNNKLMIKINPIYFDLNSSFIRKDAEDELKKVVDIMIRFPDVIIECGSHTDARASEHYNMWLSERRAKNTINYILSKGISPDRITGKGYGKSQLINNCKEVSLCSEAQHQLNRRTEFVVIRKE